MSKIQDRCGGGGSAVGTMACELYSPNLPKLLATAGFHFCIIDCEHGPYDDSMVAAMISCGRELDFDVLVRVPGIQREPILKVLDMGAAGIVVPMVSTAEELTAAVQLAKYPPLGRRGVSTTRAHTGYGVSNLTQYLAEANASTLVFAQIETRMALDNLTSLSEVDGVSGLILGPTDLSVDLGIAGERNHPDLLDAQDRIAHAAKQAGILSGVIAGDLELLQRGIQQGMQVMTWNSELGMILRSGREALSVLQP